MSFIVQPSVSKNLYNCALTSNGRNSSWSILRCCFQVIILNLTQRTFSISFLDILINFFDINIRIDMEIIQKGKQKCPLVTQDSIK